MNDLLRVVWLVSLTFHKCNLFSACQKKEKKMLAWKGGFYVVRVWVVCWNMRLTGVKSHFRLETFIWTYVAFVSGVYIMFTESLLVTLWVCEEIISHLQPTRGITSFCYFLWFPSSIGIQRNISIFTKHIAIQSSKRRSIAKNLLARWSM